MTGTMKTEIPVADVSVVIVLALIGLKEIPREEQATYRSSVQVLMDSLFAAEYKRMQQPPKP